MDRVAFGKLLESARLAKGHTLRSLAEVAKLSHGYIGRIENAGANANVTLEVLEKLLTPLGLDLALRPVEVTADTDRLSLAWQRLTESDRKVLLGVIEAMAKEAS